MEVFISILKQTVYIFLDVLEIALFARAIFSWFDPLHEGKVSQVLETITEPFLYPIRALCEKLHWFENTPIDVPFLLGWLLLSLIRILLGLIR